MTPRTSLDRLVSWGVRMEPAIVTRACEEIEEFQKGRDIGARALESLAEAYVRGGRKPNEREAREQVAREALLQVARMRADRPEHRPLTVDAIAAEAGVYDVPQLDRLRGEP